MRVLKVGIMSKKKMREYTIKIARGEIKPPADAPKIFFPSLRAMAEALNEGSQALISAINSHHPSSIKELAELVQRDQGNVSRVLKRLEEYGIVRMEQLPGVKEKKPVALADTLVMEMPLAS